MENNNSLVQALLTRIDNATNEIAKDMKAYKDAAEAGTISEEVKANAEAAIARLEALGKENDVPVTEEPGTEGNGLGQDMPAAL